MSGFNLVLLIISIYLIFLQAPTIESRPRTQKLVIHGHEWTVPDEAGWRDVLEEAELHRQKFLTNCASSRECRKAAQRLQEIFLKHPVSAKYYDGSNVDGYPSSDIDSIFKWG